MASYASTSTLIRHSVFDAALEIGLVDPKLAAWLEDEEPSSPVVDKIQNTYGNAAPVTRYDYLESSTDSERTNSLTTVPSIPSVSSQATSSTSDKAERVKQQAFRFASRNRTPKTLGIVPKPPNSSDVFPKTYTTPPNPNTSSVTKKPTMKLLKKRRGSGGESKKQAIAKSTEGSTEERGRPFAFLSQEPSPPPEEKDGSKSFFGRLRGRSRSKSKARTGTASPARARRDPTPTKDSLASNDARGRVQPQKQVHVATVTVVMTNGAPQLQLDSDSRKSSDLLTTFGSQFGATLDFDSTPPLPKPEPGSRPIMDRSYTKARNSGLWANKERGIVVQRGGGARTGGMVRKGSAAGRRSSLRLAAGGAPRRLPSSRRRAAGMSSRGTSIGSEAAFTQVVEEEVEGSDEGRDGLAVSGRQVTRDVVVETDEADVVPAVPIIVERQPSNGSALSSDLRKLILPSPSSIQTFLPRTPSPNRLPGLGRNPRNIPPSPLQPPTSALPPTPSPQDDEDESHWFEDDDEDPNGRTDASWPASDMLSAYLVPTTNSSTTRAAPVESTYTPGSRRSSNERPRPRVKPLPAAVSMRPRTPSNATLTTLPIARVKAPPSAWGAKPLLPEPSLRPPTMGAQSISPPVGSRPISPHTSPRPSLEEPARLSRSLSTSSVSGQQRGRASPFPTRPSTPSQYPSRPNSRATTPILELLGRGSLESIGTIPDEQDPISPTTGFLKRKPSVVNPIRPKDVERYSRMSPAAFVPAPTLETGEAGVARSPSPMRPPVRSGTAPVIAPPSGREQAARFGRPSPLAPAMRPQAPPVFTVRPSSETSQPSVKPLGVSRQGTFPPRNSGYSKGKFRESTYTQNTKSIYSTGEGEWESEDETDRFDLDFDDEEANGGFDVIAKMIGSGPIAGSSIRPQAQLTVPGPRPVQKLGSANGALTGPIRPLSPQPSATRPRAGSGAGGARWI